MLSLHNLWHLSRLMAGVRLAIEAGQLQEFIGGCRQQLGQGAEA
jgi:queuine/archaeosine tRNA-ribosyltransferase